MAETLLVGAVVCLLIALVASLITLRKLQQAGARIQAQQQAWERAQEARQQQWKAQQEKKALDTEKRQMDAEKQLEEQLEEQTHQFYDKWRMLEQEDKVHAENLQQQFEAAIRQVRQEYEVARLSRIEDMPLPPNSKDGHTRLALHRQAPDLKGADLSKRDLSSRYLSHGDLRDARLTQANLFMADLSWAHMANANLAGANLSASNLSHTDLRGANLEGANFLVTDLDNTILIGATLEHSHNLTPEQLRTTIYNETTRFDPEIAQFLQHLSNAQPPASPPLPERQEKRTSTEREKALTGLPIEETAEENKDAWIDTPLPQEKVALEENPAEYSPTLENSLENHEVAH